MSLCSFPISGCCLWYRGWNSSSISFPSEINALENDEWWFTCLVFNSLRHLFSSLMSPGFFVVVVLSFLHSLYQDFCFLLLFGLVLSFFFAAPWASPARALPYMCLSTSSVSKYKNILFCLLLCIPLFPVGCLPRVSLTSALSPCVLKLKSPCSRADLSAADEFSLPPVLPMSSPAPELQQVFAVEWWGHQLRCRLVARLPHREGKKQLNQKIQRMRGLKLKTFRGVLGWVLATDKSYLQSCEERLSCNKPYN